MIEEDLKTLLYLDQEVEVETFIKKDHILIQYKQLDSLYERKVMFQ